MTRIVEVKLEDKDKDPQPPSRATVHRVEIGNRKARDNGER
jgi:hypothetical protein